MAATATQKSNRLTRKSRRISGRSIMPITTASMMSAASTGFGRSEKSGARTSSVSRTVTPGVSDASPVRAPGVVVERARRQARRDRHPLEEPGPGVGESLRDRLLVDVDLVAVLGGERPRVAGGLGEADQHQRDRRDGRPCRRGPTSAPGREASNDGQPARARRRPARRPWSPRSNSQDASSPPTTRTSAPGTCGATPRSPKTTASDDDADHDRRAVRRRRASPSHDHSSWNELVPVTSVPVSLGSSPMTTSIAAPKRNPVTTARERNCAIQPILSTASEQEQHPGREGDPGDERRDVLLARRCRPRGRRSRRRPPARSSAPSRSAGWCRRSRRGSRRPPRHTGRSAAGSRRCRRSRGSSGRSARRR